MAIKESRETVIEARPEEILDVIADLEALTEWSSAHQSSEVVETTDNGRPSVARMKVKTAGITDEQVVAYTWGDNTVSWTLVSSTQQRAQDATYTLVPQGADGKATRVMFEITIDPLVPLPGFVLKRVIKGSVDTATEGLRKRVLSVKKSG
jgi:ribosome-associated toxin RatA of RatAB toxin-antitoxin module